MLYSNTVSNYIDAFSFTKRRYLLYRTVQRARMRGYGYGYGYGLVWSASDLHCVFVHD